MAVNNGDKVIYLYKFIRFLNLKPYFWVQLFLPWDLMAAEKNAECEDVCAQVSSISSDSF